MKYRPGSIALKEIKIYENAGHYIKWEKNSQKSHEQIKIIRSKLEELKKRQRNTRNETLKGSLERRIITMTGVYKMYRLFRRKCFNKMEEYRCNICSLREEINRLERSIQRT
jgi:hypothetical protein